MKLLFLTCLLLFGFSAFAQTEEAPYVKDEQERESRTFDGDKVEEFAKDSDFDYQEVPPSESLWESFLSWLFRKLSIFFDTKGGAWAYDMFIYLVIASAVIFVILRFNQISISSLLMRSSNKIQRTDFAPDDISGTDFDRLIGQATEQEDYRSAVRYLYLKLLQDLQNRNLIKWRPDFTNQEYAHQLAGSGIAKSFEKATFYFDYVFYGRFPVNEQTYQRALKRFNEFFQMQ